MTLKQVSRAQVEDLRDSIEATMLSECTRAIKGYLTKLRGAVATDLHVSVPDRLTAAATDELPTLGEVAGMWADAVDVVIVEAVRAALSRAFSRWTDQGIEASSVALEATNRYLAAVRDRLVLGTHFGVTVYDDSFNKIRGALALSSAEGWSRNELAQHIAAELGWETNGPYWRGVKADADRKIDGILDQLGSPGNPIREHAKLHDPRVVQLRQLRNEATKHLDAERSVWKTRATLIARTESTGAANYGALTAFTAEGVKTKQWMATDDNRTRPTHMDADGEVVGLNRKFLVGGALLDFPGDPKGPGQEVENCRCAMVSGDETYD